MSEKELHLIVLWNKAREKQDEIIEDISGKLQILECIDLAWTPENTINNYKRFYGFSEKSAEQKVSFCGIGNPLLITVMDNNPNYRIVESNRGFEYLNYNIFALKLKYRDLFGGLHVVHTTNNPNEVKYDICMLLGINREDYLKTAPLKWNGEIKRVKRDLSGCEGYQSFKEMFYVLNETTNYAVLRNHEMLPNEFKTDLHGDIDIICESYKNICNILNAVPKFKGSDRVYNTVGGEKIPYDIRYFGDDYYCYNFEKDMLETKIINENGVSVLSNEYYFYSLIYHAIYQKKRVSVDYYDKIFDLFCKLGLDKKYNIEEYVSLFDLYFILLKDFMKEHNYNFCHFRQKVIYNDTILHVEEQEQYLRNHYHLENIRSCKIDEKPSWNYKFFEGYFENQHVFIKTGGFNKLCKNEFKMMEKVYELNNINFVKPLLYRCVHDEQNIVMEYLEGKSLEYLIKHNEITNELKNILKNDLEDIAKTLTCAGIINRNIKPSNLILASNGHFKLIDFRFALNIDNYSEFKCLINSPGALEELGGEFIEEKFNWDDFYSISKILDIFDIKSDYIEENKGKYKIIYENSEENKVKQKTISKKTNVPQNKKNSFLQTLFSVKNQYKKGYKSKIIRILGIKISKKQKVL